MTTFYRKQYFPESADNKNRRIDGQEVHRSVPEVIPDAGWVIAGQGANQHTTPAFHFGDAHVDHGHIGLVPDVVHAIKHCREHSQPNRNHDTFEVYAITHM